MKNHPQFNGIFEMLDHCAKHYRDALSGEMPAIQVLFPDGSRDLIKTNLEDNTVEHQRIRIYKLLNRRIDSKTVRKQPRENFGSGCRKRLFDLAIGARFAGP